MKEFSKKVNLLVGGLQLFNMKQPSINFADDFFPYVTTILDKHEQNRVRLAKYICG